MKVVRISFFFILFIVLAGSATASPKNVVLVTLDTLRASRLGCYGSKTGASPNLDGLAKKGVRWTHAITPVPLTLPAHVAMMTGTYPFTNNNRRINRDRLPATIPTLAAMMKKSGRATFAIVAAAVVNKESGLSQGFDSYNDVLPPPNFTRPAGEVTRLAIEKFATQEEPFFAWLHYYDTHFPYEPPDAFRKKFSSPYDGEVAYIDSEIGRLMKELEKRPWYRDTLFVFVSDHGESLGDHNESGHGILLYNTTVEVPMIVFAPDGSMPARRVDSVVSIASLTPTIVELTGIDAGGAAFDVPSFAPLLSGKNVGKIPPVYSESFYPYLSFGWSALRGITAGSWKLIQSSETELYDLKRDPGETKDLAAEKPEKVKELLKELEKLAPEIWGERPKEPESNVSEEQAAKLKSLGYLGGASQEPAAGDEHGFLKRPNPRLRAELGGWIVHDGLLLKRDKKWTELGELMLKVLRRDPKVAPAMEYLAQSYMGLRDYARAAEVWRRIATLEPTADTFANLGLCYFNLQKFTDSIQQLEKAYSLDHSMPQVVEKLVYLYLRKENLDAARAIYRRAVEDKLNDPGMPFHGGLIALAENDIPAALAYFQDAVVREPSNADAWANLASVRRSRNETDEAIRLMEKAAEVEPASPVYRRALIEVFSKLGKRSKLMESLEIFVRDFSAEKDLPDKVEQLRQMRGGE